MKFELDRIDRLYLIGILNNQKPINEIESHLKVNLILKLENKSLNKEDNNGN